MAFFQKYFGKVKDTEKLWAKWEEHWDEYLE